jgi:hypothetical protein
MHLNDTTNSLLAVFAGIVHGLADLYASRVYPEECKLTHVDGHDLEVKG